MLILFHSMRELSFRQLAEVYAGSLRCSGAGLLPDTVEERQIMAAEQEFYAYLQEVFFRTKGAAYAVWEENGHYVSALRIEPYKDGLLIAGLETHPARRRRGYAVQLLRSVLDAAEKKNVYSHVSKRNAGSLAVHDRCGFVKYADYARYLDGSVDTKAVTLIYKNN